MATDAGPIAATPEPEPEPQREDAGLLPEPGLSDGGLATEAGAPPDSGTGQQSLETLPRDLLGYWRLGEYIGSCIDQEEYLSFFADGGAESIRIDEYACSPEQRGVFITRATYTLEGRMLTFTTELGATTRSAVANAERFGTQRLYQNLLVPVAPRRWRGIVESEAVSDEVLIRRRRTEVELSFDAELPSSGEASGSVELRYEMSDFDEIEGPGTERTAADSGIALTWRAAPDASEPRTQTITLQGLTPGSLEDWVFSQLSGLLPFIGAEIRLHLSVDQPDHLAGSYVGLSRATAPAALRR